jgi:antitoxin VapB
MALNIDRERKASVEELLVIAKRAAAHVKAPYVEHGDYLYDENGLPK